MSQSQRLLIILADGEHARFVRPGPDYVLRSETAEESLAAHKRSAALGGDRPGAAFHSESTAHHGLTSRHDLHAAAKDKFARSVADQLNEAEKNGAFDTLLLVAPAHSLNEIRDHLNRATASRVVATLEKDLLKTPDHDLAPHLFPWVRPAKRVMPYAASADT